MESFQNLIHLLMVLLCFSVDQTNAQFPVCTYDSVCAISFPISSTPQSECICPENVICNDPGRNLTIELTFSGETIIGGISFCKELEIPERTCNNTEIAVTLLWLVQSIDMVEDVKCQCSKPLSLVKTVQDAWSTFRHFACGRPTCDVCKSAPQACERQTLTEREILCRCPYGYSCGVDLSMPPHGETAEFFCKPTGNTTDSA